VDESISYKLIYLVPQLQKCPSLIRYNRPSQMCQENNIFLAIVFGYLLTNLQLLSQLKLPE
jgi:hypothetical protein